MLKQVASQLAEEDSTFYLYLTLVDFFNLEDSISFQK